MFPASVKDNGDRVSLGNIANHLTTLFLMRLKETEAHGIGTHAPKTFQKGLVNPIESYQSLVEWDRPTYEKIKEETIKRMSQTNQSTSKAVQVRFHEFHLIMDGYVKQELKNVNEFWFSPETKYINNSPSMANWNFTNLPGHNPSSWPYSLESFYNKVKSMELFGLFFEPFYELHGDFLDKAWGFLASEAKRTFDSDQKKTKEASRNCWQAISSILLVSVHVGDFNEFLKAINRVLQIEETIEPAFKEEIAIHVSRDVMELLGKVDLFVNSSPPLHFMSAIADYGGFKVAKFCQLSRQNPLNTSMTTDGTYLYLIISVPGGGMFKIGTGTGGTEPGRVYLEVPIAKAEEVSWIWLKGKLYLRGASKEFGTLEVISPETLRSVSIIQLFCPEFFGHSALATLNKFYPLLTDGEKLCLIGRSITTEILEPKVKPPEPSQAQANDPKGAPKKKNPRPGNQPPPKNPPPDNGDNVAKIVNYVLYEFDVEEKSQEAENSNNTHELLQSNPLIKELHESFSGMFTCLECQKALEYANDDMQSAAQFLLEEGEAQRTRKLIQAKSSVLLGQAEVVSELNPRNLKGVADVNIADWSILTTQHISSNNWSMNQHYVTLYSEQGIKIFSRNQRDLRPLQTNPEAQEEDRTLSEEILSNKSTKELVERTERRNIHSFEEEFDWQKTTMPAGQLRKSPELRGTLLAVLDKKYYPFCLYSNHTLSYDPYNSKFYSFIWSNSSGMFALPATIAVSVDKNVYSTLDFSNETEKDSQNEKIRVQEFSVESSNEKLKGSVQSLKELKVQLLEWLLRLNKHRMVLPSRPNNWSFILIRAMHELLIQKTNGEIPETEAWAKKYKAATKKLKSRIEKVLPTAQDTLPKGPASLIELHSLRALCVVPTWSSLTLILEEMEQRDPQNQKSLARFLAIWLAHVGSTGSLKWAKESNFARRREEIGQIYTRIGCLVDKKTKRVLLGVGWDFFMVSPKARALIFAEATAELKSMYPTRKGSMDTISPMPMEKHENYNSIDPLKFEQFVSRYENMPIHKIILAKHSGYYRSHFSTTAWLKEVYLEESAHSSVKDIIESGAAIFRPKPARRYANQCWTLPIGSLLYKMIIKSFNLPKPENEAANSADGCYEKLMKHLELEEEMKEVEEEQQLEAIRAFDQFYNSVVDISLSRGLLDGLKFSLQTSWECIQQSYKQNVNIKDPEQRKKVKLAAAEKMAELVEGALESSIKFPFFLELLPQFIILMSYVFMDLISANAEATGWRMIKVLKLIRAAQSAMTSSIGEIKENGFQNEKAQMNCITNLEGADPLHSKICETNHPYERGKTINFETIHFPGAIAIAVEFDKNCCSDTSHDNLGLVSWQDGTHQASGINSNVREALGQCYKISGRPQFKKPLVLLGNHLQVDFTSNAMARDTKSLTRWGFKVKVYPIYPLYFANQDPLMLASQIASASAKRAAAVLGSKITQTSLETKYNAGLFAWTLLRNGSRLVGINTKLSLNKEQQYTLKKEMSINQDQLVGVVPANSQTSESASQPSIVELEEDGLGAAIRDIVAKQGDISDVIAQIKRLVPIPTNYMAERRRATFTAELKKAWDRAEDLIVFVLLYHMEILKLLKGVPGKAIGTLLSEPHLADQLQAIARKRNDVLSWMLTRLQSEREYYHIFQEAIEKANQWQRQEKEIEERKREREEKRQKELKDKEEEMKNEKTKAAASAAPVPKKKLTVIKKGGQKKRVMKTIKSSTPPAQKAQEEKITETKPEGEVSTEPPKAEPVVEEKQEPLKDILFSLVRSLLEESPKKIEQLLALKRLPKEEDSAAGLKAFFEHVWDVIQKKNRNEEGMIEQEATNPYRQVAQLIENRCYFLTKLGTRLKVSTPENQDELGLGSQNNFNGEDGASCSSRPDQTQPNLGSGNSTSNIAVVENRDENVGENFKEKSQMANLAGLGSVPSLPNIQRSISVAIGTGAKDKNLNARVEDLRDYIQSYQQWKSWLKSESDGHSNNLHSPTCSPIVSAVSFLTHDDSLSLNELQKCIETQSERAAHRVVCLQLQNELLRIVQESPLEVYGFECHGLQEEDCFFSSIRAVNPQFKSVLVDLLFSRIKMLASRLRVQVLQVRDMKSSKKEPIKEKKDGIRVENELISFLRALLLSVSELDEIFANDVIMKHEGWRQIASDPNQKSFLNHIVEDLLSIGLLASTFSSFGSGNVVRVSNFMSRLKTCSISVLFNILKYMGSAKSTTMMLKVVVQAIERELGVSLQKKKILLLILARVIDPVVVSRMSFFMMILREILHHSLHEPQEVLAKVASLLVFWAQVTTVPSSQRLALSTMTIKPLFDVKNLINILAFEKKFLNENIELPKSLSDILNANSALSPEQFLVEKLGKLATEGLEASPKLPQKYSFLVSLPSEEDIYFVAVVLYWCSEQREKGASPNSWEELQKFRKLLAGTSPLTQSSPPPPNFSGFGSMNFIPDKFIPSSPFRDFGGGFPPPSNQPPQVAQPQNGSVLSQHKSKENVTKLSKLCKKIFYSEKAIEGFSQEELPLAWEVTSFDVLGAGLTKLGSKKAPRKQWTNSSLVKLDQKYRETLKLIDEKCKEGANPDISPKDAKMYMKMAKFCIRMLLCIKDTLMIAGQLNSNGFALVEKNLTAQAAKELALAFTIGRDGKLKPLPFQEFPEEWKKRLDPLVLLTPPPPRKGQIPPPDPPNYTKSKSALQPVLISQSLFEHYEIQHERAQLPFASDLFYSEANPLPLMHQHCLNGHSRFLLIQSLLDYLPKKLASSSCQELIGELEGALRKELQENKGLSLLSVGLLLLQAGWNAGWYLGAGVAVSGISQTDSVLINSGSASGRKNTLMLSGRDPTLTPLSASLSKLTRRPRNLLKPLVDTKMILDALISRSKQKDLRESEHFEVKLLLGFLSSLFTEKSCDFDLMKTEGISEFLKWMQEVSLDCPSDHSRDYYEDLLLRSWESLIDASESTEDSFIASPQVFPQNLLADFYGLKQDLKENPMKKAEDENVKIGTRSEKEEAGTYTLPSSSFVSSLPDSHSHTEEYKLLKYWEKHIIPKLQDFTRPSFKPFEFDEFFEQIRTPLRTGDQEQAAEVAYIICDQKLPPGCVLPEASHDWSTLNIEEVFVGQRALCKITYKKRLLSPYLSSIEKLGIKKILVEILGFEVRSQSVLVLHYDSIHSAKVTFWTPVSCLKSTELPLKPLAQAYPRESLVLEFKNSLQTMISFEARQVLLGLFAPANSSFSQRIQKTPPSFSSFQMLEASIVDQFSDDPVEGWQDRPIITEKRLQSLFSSRDIEGSLNLLQKKRSYPPRLEAIQNYLEDSLEKSPGKQISQIIDFIKERATAVSGFIKRHSYSFDMKNPIKQELVDQDQTPLGPGIYPLNIFKPEKGVPDSITALCVSFKTAASFCLCSGVKFFDEPMGINQINHIQAGMDSKKSSISPLVFKKSKVYYSYYFTSEALPIYLKDQVQSNLPCIVYAVPSGWSVVCWLTSALTSAASASSTEAGLDVLSSLLPIIQDLLVDFAGPGVLKQQLYGLMTNIVRKLRSKVNELDILDDAQVFSYFSLENNFIKDQCELLETLLKPGMRDKTLLASSVAQNLAEFIATLLSPLTLNNGITIEFQMAFGSPKIGREAQALIKTIELADFLIGNSSKVSSETFEAISKSIVPDSPLERLIYLKDLPFSPERTKEIITQRLLGAIEKAKGRLLLPELDFMVLEEENACVFLLDGWSILQLEEEAKKKSETEAKDQEKEEEEPPKPARKLWSCPICTLENEPDSQICAACETIKPPFLPEENEEEVPMIIEEEEPEPSISDSERLESLIETINNSLKELIDETSPKEPSPVKEEPKEKEETAPAPPKPENENENKEENKEENQEESKGVEEKEKKPERVVQILTGKKALDALGSKGKDFLAGRIFKKDSLELYPKIQRIINENEESLKKFISADVTPVELARKDPIVFMKAIEAHGFDWWFCKAQNSNGCGAKSDLIPMLPCKLMEQMLSFVEIEVCKETKASLFYPPNNLRFANHSDYTENDATKGALNYDDDLGVATKFKQLSSVDLYQLRWCWAVVKVFNYELHHCFPLIDMRRANGEQGSSLSTLISELRHYCVGYLKADLHAKVLQSTALPRDRTPRIAIERISAAVNEVRQESQSGSKNGSPQSSLLATNNSSSIFLKAFEQMKEIPPTMLRPVKPSGSDPFVCFEVSFKNENVNGQAGPYRQFFADISKELQPNSSLSTPVKNLGLLCPSPNNVGQVGENREKFLVSPSASTSYHLQLFEFLGLLMGCCVRTDTHLTLDLPTIFWKQLVGQTITLDDLDEIDRPIVKLLRFMVETSPEEFGESIFENYVTFLSDQSQKELIPGGSRIKVRYEDRFDYIDKVLDARINEAKLQMEAIKKGFSAIIPEPFISTLSAKDLEIWVCGRSKVDFNLLRRHTRYSGPGLNDEAPLIKWLWEILLGLKETEKLRFVKFCWGQERLPANDEEFERTQTRFMIKGSTRGGNHDKQLPHADTCFFNLELPKYSSAEILKERLLIAINSDCDSMDADQQIHLDPNHPVYEDEDSYEDIPEDEEYEEE